MCLIVEFCSPATRHTSERERAREGRRRIQLASHRVRDTPEIHVLVPFFIANSKRVDCEDVRESYGCILGFGALFFSLHSFRTVWSMPLRLICTSFCIHARNFDNLIWEPFFSFGKK